MRETEIAIPGGGLTFAIRGEEASLSRVSGQPAVIEVPERLESGEAVTLIERKSVLGKKQLRRVLLPDTVREIGDWAFASCSNLRQIELPVAMLGKSVFLECRALERVKIRGSETGSHATAAALLAAVAPENDTAYLMELREVGSSDWLQKWDARMMKILREADQEGFSRQILCGEEDYGVTDLPAYESNRRIRKAELCMLRLLYDRGLGSGIREQITGYLLDHCVKNSEDGRYGDETWQMIRTLHGEDRDWYELFVHLGCAKRGRLDEMLTELGEEHPELKSYLMGSGQQQRAESFFDNLSL